MKSVTKFAAAALLGLSAVGMTATAASAAIACNAAGDCWHVRRTYAYRPAYGVVVHPNKWRWEEREAARYRWREHAGRGYWRDGAWVRF